MEAIKNDSRGQSSVADAMFFFSIASILALFLFVFSTNYGTTLRNQTEKEQFREYASSALKTILYTSTPRNPAKSLDTVTPDDEIDFLLAAAKEDYADDGNFGDTAVTIKNTLRGIMQPLSTSADYMFFFYMPTEPQYQFPYFLFYRSVNNVNDTGGIQDPNRCGGEKGCHEFWYCKPTDLGAVNQFLFSLSNFSRTSSKARFLSASPIPGQTPRQVDSEVHFILWPSVVFPESPKLPTDPATAFQGLNCCKPEPVGMPENQTNCYQRKFEANTKTGGGVSFQIVPNSIRFSGGGTQKTVAFKLRNQTEKPVQRISLRDEYGNSPNACAPTWLSLPTFSQLGETVQITKDDLDNATFLPALLDNGFFVLGENGSVDEPFVSDPASQLDKIRNLYSQAQPTYNLSLYKMDSKDVAVNKQGGTLLKLCQFELSYQFQGETEVRKLRANLSISAEQ